jgi:hypothetical protein
VTDPRVLCHQQLVFPGAQLRVEASGPALDTARDIGAQLWVGPSLEPGTLGTVTTALHDGTTVVLTAVRRARLTALRDGRAVLEPLVEAPTSEHLPRLAQEVVERARAVAPVPAWLPQLAIADDLVNVVATTADLPDEVRRQLLELPSAERRAELLLHRLPGERVYTGPMLRISPAFRLALAGKGALLGSLCLLFVALTLKGTLDAERHVVVRLLSVLFAFPAWFVGWTALLAFADAVLGEAREVTGAIALRSRKAGYSLKMPDGHFAEFILWNPWPIDLVPDRAYRVIIGRRSRVMVAPPEPQ